LISSAANSNNESEAASAADSHTQGCYVCTW
jgi:hypothetical protein